MIGKEANFKSIYDQHQVLVYNVALHYLQNIEDAEEIAQDVFVQIYNTLHQFKEQSSIKTWIYRITINKSLDFIKHKKAQKRGFLFGNKRESHTETSKITNFEHPGILLENKENAEILFSVINELNENQKTAFILSKVDGLSNPEVAEIMNTSISSVESLVFRAKENLKEKLEKKFPFHRKKVK